MYTYLTMVTVPLPSRRQHPSYDDCPEDTREDYDNCWVLQEFTHSPTVLTVNCWFKFTFRLVFVFFLSVLVSAILFLFLCCLLLLR